MFYIYCVKLNKPAKEFYHSSFAQIIQMVDMYTDENSLKSAMMNNENYKSKYFSQKEEVKVCKSLSEIEGW